MFFSQPIVRFHIDDLIELTKEKEAKASLLLAPYYVIRLLFLD